MKFNFNPKFAPYIAAGVIAVLVLAGGGYFLYQNIQKQSSVNPQQSTQEEIKKLVSEVGNLIALPEGEDPTVATVTDAGKLADQPFFQRAKNGDKVLIYTQAKKAYLYDPSAKKIIDVAPINIGSPSASVETSVKVVLRNGTTTTGLTSKIETELRKTYPNLNVIDKENAARQTYEKSVIVVLDDNGKDLANNLSNILKADIVKLASDEAKPKDGDILVILGKDRI